HGWTPGGIVQRTARTPARRQNGPRPGTHLGTSAATATESEYCSRFPEGFVIFAVREKHYRHWRKSWRATSQRFGVPSTELHLPRVFNAYHPERRQVMRVKECDRLRIITEN